MYQARILDRNRNIVAVLNTTGWNYTKRRNEATTAAAVDSSRNEGQDERFEVDTNKLQYANIAYYLQLVDKDGNLKTSAVITDRDIDDNTISVEGFTEEILLERGETPTQYGRVFQGLDIADAARRCINNWHTERIAAKSQWENAVDSNNVDINTEPGKVILEREDYEEEDRLIENDLSYISLHPNVATRTSMYQTNNGNLLADTLEIYISVDGEEIELTEVDFGEVFDRPDINVESYEVDDLASGKYYLTYTNNSDDNFRLPIRRRYRIIPGQYKESGYITMQFDKDDYPNFKKWDRIRWASDNEEPVFSTMQYRYGDIGNFSDWSEEIPGAEPEKLGVVPRATDEKLIEVKIKLETEDIDSEDPEGRKVGSTPVLYSLEVIARTESELSEGDIPGFTEVFVPEDVDADSKNKLAVINDICELTGYEFEVIEGELSLYEEIGEDRTDDFVLRNGTNINIETLADDDEELVNVLKAQGEGSGLNRLQIIKRAEDSIKEYGEYPKTVEFDTDDIDELESLADDYLDTHKTPAQSFRVQALFEEEPEYDYGDKIKVADPRSGIVTTARIEEISKNYDTGGLRVQLELEKAKRGLVDAIIDPREIKRFTIPRPDVDLRGKIQGVKIKASFSDFEGYDYTEYHISTEENFIPSGKTLEEKGNERNAEITDLLPNRKYYVKVINVHENGRRSIPSSEKSIRTKGETVSSTLTVAAENSSNKGKAGADFVCENPVSQEKINEAINKLLPYPSDNLYPADNLYPTDSAGGKVVLLEGEYIVDGQINVKKNITLEGQGYETIIKVEKNADFSRTIMAEILASDIIIKDMTIIGNEFVRSGIEGSSNENIKIKNIVIKDFTKEGTTYGRGILLSPAVGIDSPPPGRQAQIINCDLINNYVGVILSLEESKARDNSLLDNNHAGMLLDAEKLIVYENKIRSEQAKYGIRVFSNDNYIHDNDARDSIDETNTDAQSLLDDGTGNKFRHNWIDDGSFVESGTTL